jgi:hypothetical protein
MKIGEVRSMIVYLWVFVCVFLWLMHRHGFNRVPSPCMFVYVCVCLCMFVYVCVCLCMFVYVCVCLCMFVYVCVCLCMFVCVVRKQITGAQLYTPVPPSMGEQCPLFTCYQRVSNVLLTCCYRVNGRTVSSVYVLPMCC